MYARGQSWFLICSTPLLMDDGVKVYCQEVCRWHKTGRSREYTRELCCHPEGPEQAGEMGLQAHSLNPWNSTRSLKSCLPGRIPQDKRDIDILERVSERPWNEEGTSQWGRCDCSAWRRLKWDLINIYKFLKGECKERVRLFSAVPSGRTQEAASTLKHGWIYLNIRKY